MEHLRSMLLEEIDSFRELGHKFENKEISSADFKATSGGMGVYAHRGGEEFMIRLRIPSGILNTQELKVIYNLAKDKNLDSVHTTTRQAIQLHGLNIDEICDVMKEAMNNGIYTRGGGGNFPVHQRTARGWDAGIWRDRMANRGVQQHVLKPAFPALQPDDQPVGGNCPGGRGERPHGRCDGPEVRRYGCGDERAV